MRKHPIQNVYVDNKGVKRFVGNRIVRFLLDEYKPGLNDISVRFFENKDDYEQLMQLIGYSLSGFGDLCAKLDEEEKACKYRTLASAEMKKLYTPGEKDE